MARRKNGFDITALEKYADQLQEAGGMAAVKRAVQGGMLATKKQVNAEVTTAMQSGNLPAGGKYSTGDTMGHLNEEMTVDWEGNMARLKLGFNMEGGGITSIFLMYGTPRHAPASGLREALKEHPKKISRKKMQEACVKILERLGK
jgi:hypothetical protein|nr:MAG TPA: hypothetical protein [Caudoviricetes sp.]